MGIGEKIIAENNFSQSRNRDSLSTQSFYYCSKNRFQFDAFLCRVFSSTFFDHVFTRTGNRGEKIIHLPIFSPFLSISFPQIFLREKKKLLYFSYLSEDIVAKTICRHFLPSVSK